MIPARMGSQRLKKKNLLPLDGIPLIVRAIQKCKQAGVFDEIWVNSENEEFGPIAAAEAVNFYQRPQHLGNNQATSEQFVSDFLAHVDCEYIFQVHSIAPLLTAQEVKGFVDFMLQNPCDALMSVVEENLECVFDGKPINFSFKEKTNSQDLLSVDRIVWAITGWKSQNFVAAYDSGQCATYSGQVGYFPVSRMAGHVIKTQDDLDMAEAMYTVMNKAR